MKDNNICDNKYFLDFWKIVIIMPKRNLDVRNFQYSDSSEYLAAPWSFTCVLCYAMESRGISNIVLMIGAKCVRMETMSLVGYKLS